MRFGGLLERIDVRDQRHDTACGEVRHDVALERVDDRRLLGDGPWPQHGAQDAQAIREHAADIELRFSTSHDADHGEPSSYRERANVLLEIRAAQMIEDDVDSALLGV